MSDLIERLRYWDEPLRHTEVALRAEAADRIEELEAEIDKAWGIIHAKSAEVERLRAVYKAAILFRRFNGTLDTDDELDKAIAAVQEARDE